MTQARAPNWDEIRKEFETTDIKLRALAEKHSVPYPTIKSRKRRDGWEKDASESKKDASKNEKDASKKKVGAPRGNVNAKGNRGGRPPLGNKNAEGHGAPIGNKNAETHGFFAKIFPEEVLPVALDIMTKNPVDMLWESIVIQYTAIARSQKIMFVRDQEDETRVLKKHKPGEWGDEREWEYQHAWDKQATFLNAQSRAMSSFFSMVEKFLQLAGKDDKRRLELEKMMQSMEIEREKLAMAKEKLELDKSSDQEDKGSDVIVQRWSHDKTSN